MILILVLASAQDWARDLGDLEWRVRERATEALSEMMPESEPVLTDAERSPDPEVAMRARQILRAHVVTIDEVPPGDDPRFWEAVSRLVEILAPHGEEEPLRTMAEDAPGAWWGSGDG